MIILINSFFSGLNLARSIDDLIVNQASTTLGLSHQKKCEFANQNLLDQQRQQVTNFIRGLKAKLRTIVQNISESRYSNVQQDADNLTANINDSISVNGNGKGFFPQTNQNIDDICNQVDPCQEQLLVIKSFYNEYFINLNKINLLDKGSEKAYEGFFSNNNFFGNKYKSISFLSHSIYGHGGTAKENSLKGEAKQCKTNDITKTKQRVPQAKFSTDKKLFEAVIQAYQLKMQTNEMVKIFSFYDEGSFGYKYSNNQYIIYNNKDPNSNKINQSLYVFEIDSNKCEINTIYPYLGNPESCD